jgi:hypothetical protein
MTDPDLGGLKTSVADSDPEPCVYGLLDPDPGGGGGYPLVKRYGSGSGDPSIVRRNSKTTLIPTVL